MTTPITYIATDYSPYVIFGASALGLLWGGWNTLQVRNLFLSLYPLSFFPSEPLMFPYKKQGVFFGAL